MFLSLWFSSGPSNLFRRRATLMIRLHVGGRRKNIYKNTPVVRLINQVVALTLNLHHFSYEERPECTQVLEQWLQLRPNKQSPLTRWEYYRRIYGCNFFNQIISAGHTNGHGGPHVARGPRVGRTWFSSVSGR